MSLCGPAVATGSTARPPGQQKSPPLIQESPKGEKRVDSPLITESILGIVSAAPVTNDKCSKDDETACYALLQELLCEDARCTNNKDASQVPLDWRSIHGEEYEEDQESLAPGSTNDNDNNDKPKGNYKDCYTVSFDHDAHKPKWLLSDKRVKMEPSAPDKNDDDNIPNHVEWNCQDNKFLQQRVTGQINNGPISMEWDRPTSTASLQPSAAGLANTPTNSTVGCCIGNEKLIQGRTLQDVRSMLASTCDNTEPKHSRGLTRWRRLRSK